MKGLLRLWHRWRAEVWLLRLWHRWRAEVWLDRFVEAKKVATYSPGPEAAARAKRCRDRVIEHHTKWLGEDAS